MCLMELYADIDNFWQNFKTDWGVHLLKSDKKIKRARGKINCA